MHAISENKISLAIGSGTFTVAADELFLAWLNQTLGKTSTELAPRAAQPPRIGEEWPEQGGVYAGIMRGAAGAPDYHIIVPTSPDAANESIAWGREDEVQAGACSDTDGLANTQALANAGGHPAAEWARRLQIGPHDDFYLPARHELRLLYLNVPELFPKEWHWSSTQHAGYPDYAWDQYFDDGSQNGPRKSATGHARAVRRLIIQ